MDPTGSSDLMDTDVGPAGHKERYSVVGHLGILSLISFFLCLVGARKPSCLHCFGCCKSSKCQRRN